MHFEKYKFSNFIQKTSKISEIMNFFVFISIHLGMISTRFDKTSIWIIWYDPSQMIAMNHMIWTIWYGQYDGPLYGPYHWWSKSNVPENHEILFYLGLLLSYTECVTFDELFKRAAKMQSKSKRWGNDDNSDFLGLFSDIYFLNHGPWISYGPNHMYQAPSEIHGPSMPWLDLGDGP